MLSVYTIILHLHVFILFFFNLDMNATKMFSCKLYLGHCKRFHTTNKYGDQDGDTQMEKATELPD